jgi:threonine/homoserine/homoserine lactone efflux protein
MLSLNFLITCLIVVLIPGTGVIFTVSTGLTAGKRASVFAALGCTAGIIPHLLASVLGLSALLHTSALAFDMLKYAGVAYLLYVSYATWRDRSAFAVSETPTLSSARSLMLRGLMLRGEIHWPAGHTPRTPQTSSP